MEIFLISDFFFLQQVRDLENQLAEERKTRLKQESRALANASAPSSTVSSLSLKLAAQKNANDKKPPLVPSRMRMPLQRISNHLPPPSPFPTLKETKPFTSAADGKENIPKMGHLARFQARRISVASVRPPPPTNTTATLGIKPRRRVSIATLRPEPSCHLTTPLHTSASRFKNGGGAAAGAGRLSFVRDPRKARYSRLFSPLPEMKGMGETTPVAAARSSKFMGSPPAALAGSNLPRQHPGAIALQKKTVVWSPLKFRGMKAYRRPSLLPSRLSSEM